MKSRSDLLEHHKGHSENKPYAHISCYPITKPNLQRITILVFYNFDVYFHNK